MSLEQIAPEALRLPVRDRVLLAASLWESLEDPYVRSADANEDEAIASAIARDEEIESGLVVPISHSELMKRLRR